MFNDKEILRKILAGEKTELALEEIQMFLLLQIVVFQEEILKLLHSQRPKLTQSTKLTFTGALMPTLNGVTLKIGQTSTGSVLAFLADGTTPSGGAVSAFTVTFSDPSATVVANPDGATCLVTGVAAGTASGSAAYTITDTDGAVSQWTTPFTVTVTTAPPPSQLTQSTSLSFTDPS